MLDAQQVRSFGLRSPSHTNERAVVEPSDDLEAGAPTGRERKPTRKTRRSNVPDRDFSKITLDYDALWVDPDAAATGHDVEIDAEPMTADDGEDIAVDLDPELFVEPGHHGQVREAAATDRATDGLGDLFVDDDVVVVDETDLGVEMDPFHAPDSPGRRGPKPTSSWRAGVPAIVAAVAAANAPLAPTGFDTIDVVQRMLLAGSITYVGAHARRQWWLIAGALLAVASRDEALVLVLSGLLVAVFSTGKRRRSKEAGAVAVGLMANAVLHFPGHSWPMGAAPLAVLAGTIVIASGYATMRSRPRRYVRRAFAALLVLVVVLFGAAGWATFSSYQDIETGSNAARRALTAVRAGDTETARTQLATAQVHLGKASDRLSGGPGRASQVVPVLAQQLHAVQVAVDEALRVSQSADDLLSTDYDSLRYQGRIDVQQISSLREPSARVEQVLARALTNLQALDDIWLVSPLRSRLDDLHEQIDTAHTDVAFASDVLDVAPGILGGEGPRRYLVAFTTPAELRGAGGFIGSWALLLADDGDVKLERSGRIRELMEAVPSGQRVLEGPAEYIARYGRYNPQDFMQDLTYSPDWPSNAQVFASAFEQSGGVPVDGVFAVDPYGLAALLQLTGPVQVEGIDQPLSADNAVKLLLRDQYLTLGDRAAREEVLADATRATFERLTDASLPAPRVLGDVLGPAVDGRHLQLWSPDGAEQALFEQIHADGALNLPEGGDGFQVVQQNVGNNKIDAYLKRTLDYQATIDATTGRLSGKITVTLRNEVPSIDLPDVVVDNRRAAPRGTSVATIALHTRQVVTEATIDGVATRVGRGREGGFYAWDTPVLRIPPGETVTIVFTIDGAVDLSNGYSLRILPQPVATPDQVRVEVAIAGGRFDGEGLTDGRLVIAQPLDGRIDLVIGTSR